MPRVPSLASPLCQLPVPPCLSPPFSRTRGRMVRTSGFPGMTGTIGVRDPQALGHQCLALGEGARHWSVSRRPPSPLDRTLGTERQLMG